MTAGSLFVALLLAHLVGDWLVQTDRQARDKTASWLVMAEHVTGYHLVVLAVLALVWPAGASELPAFVIVVVSAATHAVIDRRRPTIWLMRRTRSGKLAEHTWGIFVVDQALHVSVLAVLALALAPVG